MGYIYIYKNIIPEKIAICSLWTVCPCLSVLPARFRVNIHIYILCKLLPHILTLHNCGRGRHISKYKYLLNSPFKVAIQLLGQLDCMLAIARVGAENSWRRPKLVEEGALGKTIRSSRNL